MNLVCDGMAVCKDGDDEKINSIFAGIADCHHGEHEQWHYALASVHYLCEG